MKNKLNIFITLIIIIAAASCKKEPPKTTCGVPTGTSTSAVTSSAATLTWAAATGAISYVVQYRVQGSSTWISLTPFTTLTTTITGLAGSTNYEWQVQSVCSGGPTAFTASATFTTLAGGQQGSGLLKTITQVSTVGSGLIDTNVTYLQYDNQNRITTQIMTTSLSGFPTQSDTITYTYGANTVVQTNNLTGSITYTLNASGFRTSDNYGDTWSYNAGGYLTQSVNASATTTYTYNSLNQLATVTQNNGGNITTDTYAYPANPIGTPGSSWDMGQSTGAQPSTDLRTSGGVTYTLSFVYVTDGQGRLTKETVTSTQSGTTPVVSYFTYY